MIIMSVLNHDIHDILRTILSPRLDANYIVPQHIKCRAIRFNL